MADPMKLVPEMIEAADRYIKSVALNGEYALPAMFNWHEMWSAMLAATPPAREKAPELALEDAKAFGVGFIVDGQRVSPDRVTVCRGEEAPAEQTGEHGLHDMARKLFAAEYPGRNYDDLDPVVRIGWLGSAHVEILAALRNRTSEPEAGENSQNDYSPRKTLTDPATADKLPDDVRRLVLAARAVAFGPDCGRNAVIDALDKASEAFADRVPWDDQPLAALNEQPQ